MACNLLNQPNDEYSFSFHIEHVLFVHTTGIQNEIQIKRFRRNSNEHQRYLEDHQMKARKMRNRHSKVHHYQSNATRKGQKSNKRVEEYQIIGQSLVPASMHEDERAHRLKRLKNLHLVDSKNTQTALTANKTLNSSLNNHDDIEQTNRENVATAVQPPNIGDLENSRSNDA